MTIKYKETLFSTLGLRENTQRTNLEGGSPSQGWGSDFMEQGTFQPKGEQKSLLVCPDWNWSAVSWANRRLPSRMEAKNRWSAPVVWTHKSDGNLGCKGNLGVNGVGQLLDTGAGKKPLGHQFPFQEGYRKVITRQRLQGGWEYWGHGWGRAHHMFALWHHWDCPPLLPFATAGNNRRAHSLKCPRRALYWEKLMICLLWKERWLKESPLLSWGIY